MTPAGRSGWSARWATPSAPTPTRRWRRGRAPSPSCSARSTSSGRTSRPCRRTWSRCARSARSRSRGCRGPECSLATSPRRPARPADEAPVIKLDAATNGEYFPPRPSPALAHARALAAEQSVVNARRLGMDRRAFLGTARGTAAGLLALNQAHAQPGGVQPGGSFQVPAGAALDVDQALAALAGRELVVDVQTHYVDPSGPGRHNPASPWNIILRVFPQARCRDEGLLARVFGAVDCFSARHYVKEVFLDSDTDLAVLTFVPSLPGDTPLSIAEADHTRQVVAALQGTKRLLVHGRVHPNLPGELERMPELAER